MADTFGLLELPPVATPAPVGDPALAKLGAYLQAVLNAKLTTAWNAVRPDAQRPTAPVVQTVRTHDPKRRAFSSEDLPALFVYRTKAAFARDAEDFDQDHATVMVSWICAPQPQVKQRDVEPLFNAIGKTVRAALEAERDTSWFDAGDTTERAQSIAADPDAIVLAKTTQIAPVTYSGAGLDGVIGAATMTTRREVRIATAETVDPTYNTTDPIVVTGVNWSGRTRTWSVTLETPTGGDDLGIGEEIASVTSAALPGMLTTDGSIQIGTAAIVGHGSHVLERCGFERCRLTGATPTTLQIDVLNGRGRRTDQLPYDAVEMTLDVVERFAFDPDADPFAGEVTSPPGPGVDIDFLESDGDGVFESSSLPVG